MARLAGGPAFGIMRRVVALLVALAGALGVLLRYGISSAVHGDALTHA